MIARDEVEAVEPEITLSTAALLGLFVALVLVCGVFFGFGYSVGRRAAAIAATSPGSTADAPDHAEAGLRHAKPSGSQIQDAEREPARPATLPIVEAPPPQRDRGSHAETAPFAKPSAKLRAAPVETSQIMVQVAAVIRQEDADVLVSALRRRGYNVLVRNEPQDKLLHVQVGPFPGRGQAAAMKQKLASDGYNAILKQ